METGDGRPTDNDEATTLSSVFGRRMARRITSTVLVAFVLAFDTMTNQIAIAASAALCQVCRLEKPSSNSPMTLAASSATTATPSATASGSKPLSRSRPAAAR